MIGTGVDSLALSGLVIGLVAVGTAIWVTHRQPPTTPYKPGVGAAVGAGGIIVVYQFFVIANGAAAIETAGIIGATVTATGVAHIAGTTHQRPADGE